MEEIRAFVGHSFTEEDSGVVGTFLKFFAQLSSSHPHFTWQHAEPAEPKVLAEKVMDLFVGKNVFIGICTKKERVISPATLTPTLFSRNYLKGRADDFAWATSDWIIQEIGVAKGLGLDLVLLIERGLRHPGGLQGNVEYIPFDREAPEKCFGKIVEMIAALSPQSPAPTTATSEPSRTASEIEKDEPRRANEGDRLTPRPEWKRRQYETAFFEAIATNNLDAAEQLSRAYLSTDAGSQPVNAASWRAQNELVRMVFGKGGTLAALKQAAAEHATNSHVLSSLAAGYGHYEQHTDAAATYLAAARVAHDSAARLAALRSAARAWRKGGARG